MRKKESPQITPLMHISIFLTFGILIAKMGYGYIDTIYWLVAALLSWGISFYLLKRSSSTINAQCLSLIFCIFCMGGVLTSHQLDKKQDKPQIITEENLSSFDKTMLVTQECRNTIQKQLRSLNIQEQDFAIVSAMTLGDKTSLTKETKDIYSISGASHILAVSGLHIGIIFQLFILLLGGRRRRIPTIILSITAIWAYVIFIGMPASAIRSATMISICCFAMLSHRKALSINNLAFAYVIMLIYNPLYLFDISFQMSFMAVYSILLFYQPLEDLCSTSHFYTRWALEYALHFHSRPNRHHATHHLLFWSHLMLCTFHRFHSHPCSHSNPLVICRYSPAYTSYPYTPDEFTFRATSTLCSKWTHQYHSSNEYGIKTHNHAARSKH